MTNSEQARKDAVEGPGAGARGPGKRARRRGPVGLLLRAAAGAEWLAGIALLALATAWAWPVARWEVDIAANLTAQTALACAAVAVWCAARRGWGRAALAGLALGAAVAGLAAPARAVRASAEAPGTVVRVLTMNAYAWTRGPEGLIALLVESPADVVTIYEPPMALLTALRESEALRAAYPVRELPEGAEAGFRVMLSRWPAERIRRASLANAASAPNEGQQWRSHGRSWRIDMEESSFVLSMIHPESPRSRVRWEQGNRDVVDAIWNLSEGVGSLGMPVVLAGDFNATPTGWRSRRLSEATGYRRGKPLLIARGTWPAWSVWPARVAIDDVMVSPGVRLISWEALAEPPASREKGVRSSDHLAVLATLLLPAHAADRRYTDQ